MPQDTNLDSDDLNRLIPSCESTTDGRSSNLLKSTELLVLSFTLEISNGALGKTSKTHTIQKVHEYNVSMILDEDLPRTPICALANSDGIDTLVNTTDTFSAPDVREDGPR